MWEIESASHSVKLAQPNGPVKHRHASRVGVSIARSTKHGYLELLVGAFREEGWMIGFEAKSMAFQNYYRA